MDQQEKMPEFIWQDALDYIAARCDLDIDTIEQVLLLEEDYMRTVGIIVDEDE